MKNLLLLYCCLLFGLLLSCHKDPPTIIKGRITDKTTGAPVKGAYAECYIHKEFALPHEQQNISVYADNDGNYLIESPDDYYFDFSAIYSVTKYLTYVDPARSIEIKVGETNIIDAALIPKDSFIKLKIHNDLPQSDSLYVIFFSPISNAQPYIGGYLYTSRPPSIIPFAASMEQVFAFPSEEFITIEWGTMHFAPSNGPYRDSVYVTRNDTVDFSIHF